MNWSSLIEFDGEDAMFGQHLHTSSSVCESIASYTNNIFMDFMWINMTIEWTRQCIYLNLLYGSIGENESI